MSVDDREVREFAADLRDAPQRVVDKVPGVVKKGAQQIKDQLMQEMGESAHFKGVVRSIGYDITDGGFQAEIGPSAESGQAGNLANIAYFGGANSGGGSVPDPQGALDAEAPRAERALLDLLGGAL